MAPAAAVVVVPVAGRWSAGSVVPMSATTSRSRRPGPTRARTPVDRPEPGARRRSSSRPRRHRRCSCRTPHTATCPRPNRRSMTEAIGTSPDIVRRSCRSRSIDSSPARPPLQRYALTRRAVGAGQHPATPLGIVGPCCMTASWSVPSAASTPPSRTGPVRPGRETRARRRRGWCSRSGSPRRWRTCGPGIGCFCSRGCTGPTGRSWPCTRAGTAAGPRPASSAPGAGPAQPDRAARRRGARRRRPAGAGQRPGGDRRHPAAGRQAGPGHARRALTDRPARVEAVGGGPMSGRPAAQG